MIEISRGSNQALLDQIKIWLHEAIFTWETTRQAFFVLLALLSAFVLARLISGMVLSRLRQHWGEDSLRFSLAEKFCGLVLPLLGALIMEVTIIAYCWEFHQCHILKLSAKLAWAWLLVRLFTSFMVKGVLSRFLVVSIYFLIFLEIFGLLQPLTIFLDRFGVQLDNARLSLLSVVKGGILAFFLLALVNFICKSLEASLPQSTRLSPRQQLLVLKSSKLVLYTLAVVVALDSVGLDFYLISIFSGAFGLGVGLGLQRVIANLFSGFVILMDRSIRPGDVIETEGLYGWIESLRSRYVSLMTRDGKSHLIPNEHFINNKVVNWSFSHPNVRLKIPLGISYDADLNLAIELMLAAATKNPRVLEHPPAVARLMNFGDSAVNLELRFWINDPQNGIADICSDIQIDIWNAFQAGGIGFPFPQRDVHLKGGPQVTVVVREQPPPGEAGPTASGDAGSGESPSPPPPAAGPPPRRSGPGSAAGE